MKTKEKAFLLRLPDDERDRAKRLADELGYSENRLYSELIHDGLLMREQMAYMTKLPVLGQQVSRDEIRVLLDKVPDVEPEADDR
jgi:hypothetical protein